MLSEFPGSIIDYQKAGELDVNISREPRVVDIDNTKVHLVGINCTSEAIKPFEIGYTFMVYRCNLLLTRTHSGDIHFAHHLPIDSPANLNPDLLKILETKDQVAQTLLLSRKPELIAASLESVYGIRPQIFRIPHRFYGEEVREDLSNSIPSPYEFMIYNDPNNPGLHNFQLSRNEIYQDW